MPYTEEEVRRMREALAELNLSKTPSKPPDQPRIITLDEAAADNGSTKTQNQWIGYWNTIQDGRVFSSAPDLYQAFKQLKSLQEGSPQERQQSQSLIDSLRQDFRQSWVVTSTRLIHQPNTLDTKIIHHFGNKDPSLIQQTELEVPEYLGIRLANSLSDPKLEIYLQSLLDTKDNIEEITKTLEFISNKPRPNIKIWTPPLQINQYLTRQQYPERAARFGIDAGGFRVVGGGLVDDDDGRSWGVRKSP